MSSGFAILKMELLQEIRAIGFLLLIIAPLLLVIGASRFFYVKWHLKKYYDFEEEKP